MSNLHTAHEETAERKSREIRIRPPASSKLQVRWRSDHGQDSYLGNRIVERSRYRHQEEGETPCHLDNDYDLSLRQRETQL